MWIWAKEHGVYYIYPYKLTYFKNFLSYWVFKSNWNSCTCKIVNSPAWEKYIYEMQQKTQKLIISERKQIKKIVKSIRKLGPQDPRAQGLDHILSMFCVSALHLYCCSTSVLCHVKLDLFCMTIQRSPIYSLHTIN